MQLSEQICPWDTLACCWDVKQPTNKQLDLWMTVLLDQKRGKKLLAKMCAGFYWSCSYLPLLYTPVTTTVTTLMALTVATGQTVKRKWNLFVSFSCMISKSEHWSALSLIWSWGCLLCAISCSFRTTSLALWFRRLLWERETGVRFPLLMWIFFQADSFPWLKNCYSSGSPAFIGSVLGLIGPVSVYCE